LAFGLLLIVMLLTFLVLRQRVSKPIIELTDHVSEITREEDYSRDLAVDERWPKEVGILANNFNELMAHVRSSHDQLQEFSLHDPLTNLYNRRRFDAVLERASFEAQQHGQPFSVLLLDLDYFKPVNDKYGHAAGDAVLVGIAKAMQEALRDTDLAARIGGDEFAVIALATDGHTAVDLAERLKTAISACQFRFGHDVVHVGCSIGIANYPENGMLAADLVQAADRAMYEDKDTRRAGR
jgi:diguanylate cyclase (GGDEF)-like protein